MILNVGVDYHNMGVEEREHFSLSSDQLPHIYREVLVHFPQIIFISTCNRMEVYFKGDSDSPSMMIKWLIHYFIPSSISDEKREEFKKKFYLHRDGRAIRHLFEVASGLHSMVVGENQILHQIKKAYQEASTHIVLDSEFHKLFQNALALGKKVRTQTDIGKGGMSLGSVSVDIIKKFYEKNSHFTIALVGAGEIAEEVLKSLLHHGRVQVQICNRDTERAHKLRKRYQPFFTVEVIPFDERYRIATEANVIVVSTNAPHHTLTRTELEKKRGGYYHFSFFIDLSVPRNIDPKISDLPDVVLYTLDDLDKIIHDNYSQRFTQVNQCHNLIEEQIQEYWEWWKKRHLFMAKQKWEQLLRDVNKERQGQNQEPIPSEKLHLFFDQYYQKLEGEEIELNKDYLARTLEALPLPSSLFFDQEKE